MSYERKGERFLNKQRIRAGAYGGRQLLRPNVPNALSKIGCRYLRREEKSSRGSSTVTVLIIDDFDVVDIEFACFINSNALLAVTTTTKHHTFIIPLYLVIVLYLIVQDNSIGLLGRWP